MRENDGNGYDFVYNFTVDWGDDTTVDTITAHDDPDRIHTYASAGDYTVTIKGTVEAWSFDDAGDKDKILEVKNFGKVGWKNLNGAFRGCSSLTTFEGGDVSQVTDMSYMFELAVNVTPNVSRWNTSRVTTMREMFGGAYTANPDVSNWDTSRVTDMSIMFSSTGNADPDVSNWNTSRVTNMSVMFSTSNANPDISNWDTSNVTDMSDMFYYATSANPDMSALDLSSVTNFNSVFEASAISDANYSAFLIRAEATNQNDNISLGVVPASYSVGDPSTDAEVARQALIDDHNWTIPAN